MGILNHPFPHFLHDLDRMGRPALEEAGDFQVVVEAVAVAAGGEPGDFGG